MQITHAVPAQPNKDQSLLKLVAILTMVVDHTGVIFFPGQLWLRIIGRIAFPLFCWGIVIGAERTKNWQLYGLRLFLLGLATQPFFMLALNHSLTQFNVLATLFLGFMAIQGIKHRWFFSHIWAPALALFLGAAFQMDYGWRGVLLIILMYLARHSKGSLAALMIAFCLYWGTGGGILPRAWLQTLTSTPFQFVNRAFFDFFSLFKVQSMAILALPLMLINTNSGLRIPKWFSYLAYPGHLLLLYLISRLV